MRFSGIVVKDLTIGGMYMQLLDRLKRRINRFDDEDIIFVVVMTLLTAIIVIVSILVFYGAKQEQV